MEIIFQISFFLFAFFSGIEEAAFTWPFRFLVNDQFNYGKKKELIGVAHKKGAWGVLILLLMCGSVEALNVPGLWYIQALSGLFIFGVCGLWYWMTFDVIYSVMIGKGLFYLGDTASTDNKVVKILGANAGKKKAVGCAVLIICFNLIFYLFL